jgi:hypothetical protein
MASKLLEEVLKEWPNLKKRERPTAKPPKLVTDEGQIVGSATVHLSPGDPNWRGSNSQIVKVLLDRRTNDGPIVRSAYDPLEALNNGGRFHG